MATLRRIITTLCPCFFWNQNKNILKVPPLQLRNLKLQVTDMDEVQL